MSAGNREVVHEGWLIKSPPTKRILRAVCIVLTLFLCNKKKKQNNSGSIINNKKRSECSFVISEMEKKVVYTSTFR